jgi:hypothetical protein
VQIIDTHGSRMVEDLTRDLPASLALSADEVNERLRGAQRRGFVESARALRRFEV